MLRLGIGPEKLYRASFICQDDLCCCNMALISFPIFHKNLGNLRNCFGQMVYRTPWQKISRTPMMTVMSEGLLLNLKYSKMGREDRGFQALLTQLPLVIVCHELIIWRLTIYGFAMV